MIRAVVFDLDGMLHTTKELFSIWIARKLGVKPEEVTAFFKGSYQLARLGKADTNEVLKPYANNWKTTPTAFLQEWFVYGEMNTTLLTLARQLKEGGVATLLVTNNEPLRIAYLTNQFNMQQCFNYILTSAQVGFLKPEEPMFDRIVQVAGCNKEQVLFCDDKQKFIDAAEEYGFQTHLYTDVEKFKEAIASLL